MASTKEHLASTKKWLQKNPHKRIFWTARTRSKRDKFDFNLLIEDIIIPEYCPYLGVKLTNIQGKGMGVPTNASLDRIDNSLGYIKGNIQVISNLANRMKANSTKEELILFAENILKMHKSLDRGLKV